MRNKFLKLELVRTLYNLQHYLEKLESHEYYSDNSGRFLVILRKFVAFLQENYDKVSPSSHERLLRILNFKIIPLIRYVQRSQSRDVPWSLIPNFEKLIQELLGSNYIVLLRPQWHWNYSVLVNDITRYLQDVVELHVGKRHRLKIDENVHVISFPILEKTNFLSHTIIGHEIGHFYQQLYFSRELTVSWEKKTINRLLGKKGSPRAGATEFDPQVIEGPKEVLEIYRGMVREIIPDLIGYLLLGPSMLFALHSFSFWNKDDLPPNKKNRYYPPLKFRIRTLHTTFFSDALRAARKDNSVFSKTIRRFNRDLVSYLSDENDIRVFRGNEHASKALELFENTSSQILAFAKNRVKKRTYNFSSKRIDGLIGRITDTIPPNEIDTVPVDLGDIFLAGWVYYYDRMLDKKSFDPDCEEYNLDYIVLSRLLLKASNLAYIHTLFTESRNGNAQQN